MILAIIIYTPYLFVAWIVIPNFFKLACFVTVFLTFFITLGTNILEYHHIHLFVRIIHENFLSMCRIFVSFSMNIAKLCSTFYFSIFDPQWWLLLLLLLLLLCIRRWVGLVWPASDCIRARLPGDDSPRRNYFFFVVACRAPPRLIQPSFDLYGRSFKVHVFEEAE